jgi:hypothetical protein
MLDKEFRSQHDMRKLVLSAICKQDKDVVVAALGEDVGIARIREIMQQTFVLGAGNRKDAVSFQRVAVPLVALLANGDVANSTRSTAARKLYAAADSEARFLPNYLAMCEHLVANSAHLLDRVDADKTAYDPSSVGDVVQPLVEVVLLILTRLTDAPADEKWTPFMQRLARVIEQIECPERQLRSIGLQFTRANSLVQQVLNEREARAKARAVFDNSESERLAQALAFEGKIDVPREVEPPPGELRDGGPRHDNDRVDFREIRVLPTAEEVLCRESAYLPHQRLDQPELASPFVAGTVDRHLDVQFRLLREDMLAPLQRAVHAFVDARPLATASARECHFASEVGRDRVSCVMFRNFAISDVAMHMSDGVSVIVEFDQHPDIATRTKVGGAVVKTNAANRKHFWKDGRGEMLLQPDSVVIVVLNAPKFASSINDDNDDNDDADDDDVDDDTPQIVLATVLHKGRDHLGENEHRCKSLQLRPLGNDLLTLIEQLGCKPRVDCEHLLLQVRGHFYAGYEPVLRALQRQDVARLPFLERLAPHYGDGAFEAGPMLPPAFVNARTRFDLQCIAVPEASADVRLALASVAPTSYAAMRTLLHAHEASLVLDETQIDAFALALTHEVALIQGPPGTGKTYVGVQIVRALLANSAGMATESWTAGARGVVDVELNERPRLEPILCVCYTNHALDQFLEHLIDTGVVPLSRVVRVGGRSRSEKLSTRTLHAIRRRNKAEWAQFDALKRRCNDAEQRIAALRAACTRATPSEEWLREFDRPLLADLYKAAGIDLDNDDDDDEGAFQIVGGFSALVERWLREPRKAEERARRWQAACDAFVRDQIQTLSGAVSEYGALVAQVREIDDQTNLRALREAGIVAFTTSGAAKHDRLLHALRPRVIVCEEAGEVFEAHVLASLTSSAQSLILIGDHQQLRPKPSEYRLSVETSNGHNLDVSLFERLISSGAVEFCTLGTQRRMRPEIADLIRAPLYPELRDHAVVRAYPAAPRGFEHPLWFMAHRNPERDDFASKTNAWEADMVVALVRYVVRQGYSMQQIAVLTPYVGQLKMLRSRLRSSQIMLLLDDRDAEALDALDDGSDGADDDDADDTDDDDADDNSAVKAAPSVNAKSASLQERIRLATVDNFQGEEAEIVIVSTVRSNSQHRTGFLKVDNRVNVMLSRAKHGMIVLGSVETIKGCRRAKLANAVVEQLTRTERIGPRLPLRCEIHHASFTVGAASEVPVDGGCMLPCGARKACGHACRRLCHPDDRQHRIPSCREPCMRVAPCGHACVRLCEQTCECREMIDVKYPCGHTHRLACSVARQQARWPPCAVVVTNQPMPHCAHKRDVRCSELRSGALVCTALCGRSIAACGHACERRCTDCAPAPAAHAPECEKRCERALMCGHTCGVTPCHSADECPPCGQQCTLACEHSGCERACHATCPSCAHPCAWKCEHHSCELPCASLCERALCDVRCALLLACGHRCPSLCGERCPSSSYCVECCAAAPTKETLKTRDSVVDLLVHTTLAELDLSEAGCELLVLSCGHAFTRETLDGQCEMAHFYRDGAPVPVAALAAVVSATPPRCPTCAVPISGVRRYSRVMNWYALATVQRKWQINAQLAAPPLWRDIVAAEKKLLERAVDGAAAPDRGLRQQIESIARGAKTLFEAARQAPTRLVWEGERAARLQAGDARESQLVEPLAAPLLIARDIALRLLQLQILSVTRNFDASKKNKKNKKQQRDKENADADEPSANVDEMRSVGERQLQLVRTRWRAARVEHAALARGCEQSHSSARLRDAHMLFARLALVCAEELRGLLHAERAAAARAALLQVHNECVGEVEEMIKAAHVPEAPFAGECARAKKAAAVNQPLSAEERRAIFEAMAPDVGSGHGSFGGHWFQCRNGHVYTIGECGGAMQASRCPECGEVIGGAHHQLAEGNAVASEYAHMQN